MTTLRFKMVEDAIKRKASEVKSPGNPASEYYGIHVFNREKMAEYLTGDTFRVLADTIDNGTSLSREVADRVAQGMKKWAMKMGATHYTHWFQPLTGGTAEKHDAFLEMDGKGGMIEEFSGKLLIQQEPDASSFPSGGIRNTFEARGYSAWDATSPAFIVDTTLCIPTVFISYTGDALDYKVPLLKAEQAVSKAAVEVCRLFDASVSKVMSYLGWEQEYFLVDEGLWAARPDLMLTGRTLVGHESARNQQLEDHYFGAIPTRVMAFMKDLEYECLKLGIPVKTRHNEVAPNQFELAPVFERTNLANDHNQLLMAVMKKVARRHCFRLLLHEKPFKGINGSGKHCNWSLGTDTGVNLLSPGKSPVENLQFVTFLVNILTAVYHRNGLLKASISTATNAHRLGANEAPPAIISSFLGKQLSEVLDRIAASDTEEVIRMGEKTGFHLNGITHIPELLIDNTDRNRTSPFAFTGNRFEFRAVGSSANCARAMIVLNTAVAQQLTVFKREADALIAQGKAKENAIYTLLKKYIRECAPIRFEGNGYCDAWKEEAKERGLDCETSIPVILQQFTTPETVKMFGEMGVLTGKELQAREEVYQETYTKKIQIEARVLGDLAINHVIPVAARYQNLLLEKMERMNRLFSAERLQKLAKYDMEMIERLSVHISEIQNDVEQLANARKKANKILNERGKAVAYHDTVLPWFDKIRYHIDKLELYVDDEMWTLPKYRELLFIR